MRSILFDELLPPEVAAVEDYLKRQAQSSGLDGLFWVPLPRDLWNESQKSQVGQDKSGNQVAYRFAVELATEWVRFELLMRSEGLRDVGGQPADEKQTLFILRWADEMARKLNLISCAGNTGPGEA